MGEEQLRGATDDLGCAVVVCGRRGMMGCFFATDEHG